MNYTKLIKDIAKQKKAVILAHYYQVPEIQDLADFVGDSLGLAKQAAETQAEIIVFAGVLFMAETAKILNSEKKVLLPDLNAGCSLADSCGFDDFVRFRERHPGHIVISYINCSVEIKSVSDVICTSGNAVEIVQSFPQEEKIIFAPDKNLGNYINQLTGRNMVLWDGVCKIHDVLKTEKIVELKMLHRDAKLVAHPECRAIVLEMADFIGSTQKMIQFIEKDDTAKYIIATETGIVHQMKKIAPHKEFIIVPADETCACNDCEYMKLITPEKLYQCLLSEKPEITLEPEMIEKAGRPIRRMFKIMDAIKN
jgi:quinolinate synthase